MRIAVLAIGLTFAIPAMAQSNCATTVRVAAFIWVNERVELVPITDIQARVEGKPVRVTAVLAGRKPLRAILVLDASGSMRDLNNISLAIAGMIVRTAEPGSRFGSLMFSEREKKSLALTNALTDAHSTLVVLNDFRGYHSGGRTPLWAAVDHATSMLEPNSTQDAVIVLSDGGNNAGPSTPAVALRHLTQAGVRLFAVPMVADFPRTEEERSGPEELRSIAEQSGGFSVPLNDQEVRSQKPNKIEEKVTAIVNTIVALATNSYEVSFERPPSPKPERLKLNVGTKKARLIYPHILPPCATDDH